MANCHYFISGCLVGLPTVCQHRASFKLTFLSLIVHLYIFIVIITMTQMRIVSLIFLVLLALCAVVARPNNDEANEIISIYNERNCLHQGGICVKEDFCSPSLRTAIKGLCPEQSHMGVECCYWDELP